MTKNMPAKESAEERCSRIAEAIGSFRVGYDASASEVSFSAALRGLGLDPDQVCPQVARMDTLPAHSQICFYLDQVKIDGTPCPDTEIMAWNILKSSGFLDPNENEEIKAKLRSLNIQNMAFFVMFPVLLFAAVVYFQDFNFHALVSSGLAAFVISKIIGKYAK